MKRLAAAVACTGVLLLPALINGFPILFYDSGEYVRGAFNSGIGLHRSVFYSLFIYLTSGFGWLGLWGVVVAQAAVTVFCVHTLLRVQGNAELRTLFFSCTALALFTPLPWETSELMPDIFTFTLVVSSYVVLCHWKRLSHAQRVAVAACLLLSLVTHLSHLAIALAAALVLQTAAWTGRISPLNWRPFWCALALALALVVGAPQLSSRPRVGSGLPIYLVQRLAMSGLISRLLDEHCDDQKYALCVHRERFEKARDNYQFDPNSPLQDIGGWEGSAKESYRMVGDCVKYYPGAVLLDAAGGTLEQLTRFKTLNGFATEPAPQVAARWVDELRVWFPCDAAFQSRALQWHRRLNPLLSKVAAFHAACSLLVALGLLWRFFTGTLNVPLLGFFSLFALLNAAICSAVCQIDDRYQSRVIALFLLAWLARGPTATTRSPQKSSPPPNLGVPKPRQA